MVRPKYLHRLPCAPLPYWTLCLSEAAFKRELRELKIDDIGDWITPGANATAHFNLRDNKGQPITLVCMDDTGQTDPVCVAGLLVHEAVHIWQHYRETYNEREPGSEQEAYAVQAISQELMWEYVRQKKGAKP